MQNNTSKVVSLLSVAIDATVNGNEAKAMRAVIQAIGLLNLESAVAPVGRPSAATGAAKTETARKRRRKTVNRAKPLTKEQVAVIRERVAGGETVSHVAKTMGIKYQTVYMWARDVRPSTRV